MRSDQYSLRSLVNFEGAVKHTEILEIIGHRLREIAPQTGPAITQPRACCFDELCYVHCKDSSSKSHMRGINALGSYARPERASYPPSPKREGRYGKGACLLMHGRESLPFMPQSLT